MELGKLGVCYFLDGLPAPAAAADLENGGSDTFIDTNFASGSAERIRSRIQAHFDAGASHLCIQPVNPNGQFGDLHWETLEAPAS